MEISWECKLRASVNIFGTIPIPIRHTEVGAVVFDAHPDKDKKEGKGILPSFIFGGGEGGETDYDLSKINFSVKVNKIGLFIQPARPWWRQARHRFQAQH